jgi:protein N-terminal methyltransferase
MLLKVFKKVDLVEQNGKFLDSAKQETFAIKVENFVNLGLQSFTPEKGRYDLIWCQWVLGHLTDEDLVSFFTRCRESGCKFIAIKEHIARETVYFDSEDSSVNRTDPLYKTIFEKAGLKLVKEEVQKGFPDNLFPVKMYMLQPNEE